MTAAFAPLSMPLAGACWRLVDDSTSPEGGIHYSLLMVGPGVDAAGEPASLVVYRRRTGGEAICCGLEAFTKGYEPCRNIWHYHPVALAQEQANRQWLRDTEKVAEGLGKLVGQAPSGVGPYLDPFHRIAEAALQRHIAMDTLHGQVRKGEELQRRLAQACRPQDTQEQALYPKK